MTYGAHLRDLIDRDDILVCPGIHDSLTARVAEMTGFDTIYMTGHGTSISLTGYPDAGLVTMTEVCRNARNIQETVDTPVIADIDNGYGNATNVIRTVREFAKTDVAGIQLEDQVAPKRCGHVAGRKIVTRDEAVGKYRAAADVRDERAPEMVIVARTDALGAIDGSLDDAIDRANAYADAGADLIFIESPETVAQLERIAREVDAPLFYNNIGISPALEPTDLESIGFDVVIYPIAATRAAIIGAFQHLADLLERGTAAQTDLEARFDDLPIDTDFEDPSLRTFLEFGGFPQIYEWEARYLPDDDRAKYEGTIGEDLSTR